LSALHLEIRQSAEREKHAAELAQQQQQLELQKAQILAQRDGLQKDVDQARHALAERDKQLSNLTADLSQQVEWQRDKDMALATLQREAKDREDTLLAAQEQVMRLTAEHKEQMAKILALQQRVEDKDESLRSFRQVVEDKELVMKSTRAEVAALAGLKGEHEERIRLLRQDVESKDAALNAMREQVALLTSATSEHQDSIKLL
jgi:chromosome segregation ATPase